MKNILASKRLTQSLVLLLLLLILAPQIWLWPVKQNLNQLLWHGVLPALLFLLLLLSCSRYLHRSVWLCLPFALMAPQELFYLSTYQKSTDAHAMAIIAETDLAEAAGYLSGLGWLMIPAILFLLLIFALCSAMFKVQQLHWPRYARPVVWLLCLLGVGWVWQQERQYQRDYPPQTGRNATETALSQKPLPHSHNLFYQSYPLNLLLAANEFRVQRAALATVAATVAEFKFGAVQPEPVTQRQIYLLVIGETLRPDRLQLNGYSRPTTPRLAGLGDVVSFQNMISPWAWTRMSVPVIISRKSAQDQSYFSRETSLVAAFKEAGFHTTWLSTQSPLGVHDSSVALHASEADVVQYLNPVGYKKEGYYDDILLKTVQRVLASGEPKQLIVLHTLGSHFSYADRYPPAFDLFKPSGKGRAVSMHNPANKTLLNNAYDNSVAFTDAWLFGLIQTLKQQKAISSLLLVSDHGENIFDGQCTKSGHGHHTEFDYRVAAFWWGSAEFRQAYPAQVALLQQRQQAPLMTSQTFETMLDLAQIRYPNQRLEQSFAAATFAPGQRMLSSGQDFDQTPKDQQCRAFPLQP
jgi:glucan phosphoethanolaminetransferase (alkaline phosphatase superfamily)